MTRKFNTFVGVDVGAKAFHVAFDGREDVLTFDNTADGQKKLVRYVKKHSTAGVRVVLESTGVYGLDLALALHAVKRFEVVYVNPRAAKGFASAGMVRAKTDRIDAHALAAMAAAGRGQRWQPPSMHQLQVRQGTRRLRAMVDECSREKNRLKSSKATGTTASLVADDIREHIQALEQRIVAFEKRLLAFAFEDATLREEVELLCTTKGVAARTALAFVAELRCLPANLTPAQVVACAGLDPRAKQSGAMDAPRHISKMGTKYLRLALHFAALNTVQFVPEVAAHHAALVARGKSPLVAYVAIARKLIHVFLAMLSNKSGFNAAKFGIRARMAAAA